MQGWISNFWMCLIIKAFQTNEITIKIEFPIINLSVWGLIHTKIGKYEQYGDFRADIFAFFAQWHGD